MQLTWPDDEQIHEFFQRQDQRTLKGCIMNRLFQQDVNLLAKAFRTLLRGTEIKVIRLKVPIHYRCYIEENHRQFWPEDGLMFELLAGYDSGKCLASEEGYEHVEKVIKKAIEKNKKIKSTATGKKLNKKVKESGEDPDDDHIVFTPWTAEEEVFPPEWEGRAFHYVPPRKFSDLPDEIFVCAQSQPQSHGSWDGTPGDDEWPA